MSAPRNLEAFGRRARQLREGITAALVEAGLEDPPAAVLHGKLVEAFELGVQTVIDHVGTLHHVSIDYAEFDYDEEVRAAAPFTPEEAK